ncbi:MAG TPA: hypothetical protein VGQ33_15975 [Vicinamibacteria bacterium]|nr:hypothetical protein [Vicinamibacteria bacterium]
MRGIRLEGADLAAAGGLASRYLERFSLPALCAEMDQAGVLPALRTRGYDPSVRIDVEEGEHRLLVTSSHGREVLIDLRMREEARPVSESGLRSRGIEVLSVLVVEWLSLQDPRAVFTRERPRLPGQTHPGLGLGRQLYGRVLGWAAAWGKDGLVNVPAFFHNAKFYAPPFAFLAAAEQGRFEALCRDLAGQAVADASAALEAGRVVEVASGEPVTWSPGDMLAALSPPVREYLASPEHTRAVAAARDAHHFRVAESA